MEDLKLGMDWGQQNRPMIPINLPRGNMHMIIQVYATIDNKFKTLIQGGNYEDVVLKLLNSSTKLFPNRYERILLQPNGECDFIDIKTKEKYDAKLPITKKQGQYIGSNNSDFEKWLESMRNECVEYGEKIIKRRELHRIEELTLYKIMKKQIEDDKLDENIIFFFPFPVVYEGSNSIYRQFASDILSSIYTVLNKNGIIHERKIYAIYPSIDNMIGIRLLNTGVREWLSSDILDGF